MKTLSIVIPVYNEERNLTSTVQGIVTMLQPLTEYSYTMFLVDDGSADSSWNTILNLSKKNPVIKGIKLSKNFGKDFAILAGLSKVDSDYCLVIDADGEHPIEEIPQFLKIISETNVQVVHGVKSNSNNKGLFYLFLRKVFNRTFSVASRVNLADSSDYKIMSRDFVKALLDFQESDFFFRAAAQFSGFRSIVYKYAVEEKKDVDSSWSKFKLIRFALNSLVNYTHMPLHLIFVIGIVFMAACFLISVKLLYSYFYGSPPEGYATLLMVNLISFSILVFFQGILGIYISKVHQEVKRRPRYLIEEST